MSDTNIVIKGGYFNVSTKPAEPRVDTIAWGTAVPTSNKKRVLPASRTRTSRPTAATR